MKKRIINLLNIIESLPRRNKTLIIGIDGCGGSGKSTLARKLRDYNEAVTLIEMDDFYKPSAERPAQKDPEQVGLDFDWKRVQEQILIPLNHNKPCKYQRYDWDKDMLSEWKDVPDSGVVIVEGVYSTRLEISQYYDYKIWVDCPYDIRLSRGIDRDGEAARDRWEKEWMPEEEKYINKHQSFKHANLVLDGSNTQSDIHKDEIFVLQDANNLFKN